MRAKIIWLVAISLAVLAGATVFILAWRSGWTWHNMAGKATVETRLAEYGPAARNRLSPYFKDAGLTYPPAELVLIGIKDRKVLEIWARQTGGPFKYVRSYPILAASGRLGPKLREGDQQVPEGLYQIESLNSNSLYHLALRVNYPNDFDRRKGCEDGRGNLGGDIMIHGSNGSVGCLAMGDEVSEDLFVLAADTGIKKVQLILTPVDFRNSQMPASMPDLPAWTGELYAQIRSALRQVGTLDVNK
ncbi:MAG: hypothetical protein HZA50_10735 [Planctomycetes bacterium]|nr:hypothetical protein [Planctomycetota bacterium]